VKGLRWARRRGDDKPERQKTTGRSRVKRFVLLAIAALALFSIGRTVIVMISGGSGPGGGENAESESKPKTPPPTVDLNGAGIPVTGQPIIILNPGLVRPGAKVGLSGSGFDAGARVDVFVTAGKDDKGKKPESVASATATKDGTVAAEFGIPAGSSERQYEVQARQRGSDKSAKAVAMTAAGVATMTLKPDAGQPGSTVEVSAEGFAPNEEINVHWGSLAGEPSQKLRASPSGGLTRARVPVGVSATGNTTLMLIGNESKTAATASFLMLGLYPTVTMEPYAAKAGERMGFSGKGFAPGERVLVYVNSAGDKPSMTVDADGAGAFANAGFKLPYGLQGKQSLIVIGEQSRASVQAGFTLLPYIPLGRASIYGGMPGTTLSFYVTGFAPNEAVHVRAGGGQGNTGKLVTAFRVDNKGSAAAAGSYVIPGDAQKGVTFTLTGAKSKASATVTVEVNAPDQPVNVPPQPEYKLPPDLTD
jgi:hypothetical protein